MDDNQYVDVVGIVHLKGDPVEISLKAGESKIKTNIILVDQTNEVVTCTFWGNNEQLLKIHEEDHPVIAIKGARVSKFGGRSVNCSDKVSIHINPDHKKLVDLKKWYEQHRYDAIINEQAKSLLEGAS